MFLGKAPLTNPRHEKFCQKYASGKSATEAYSLAGYKSDRRNADRLTTYDAIKTRVAELQTRNAASTEITVRSLVEELNGAIQQAEMLGQPTVRVSAAALKARLAGLDVKRMEIGAAGQFGHCESVREVVDAIINSTDDVHELIAGIEEFLQLIIARVAEEAQLVTDQSRTEPQTSDD
jgi:hypothetical protein